MDLEAAHDRSYRNRPVIERSTLCGCFHCLGTYPPTQVIEWVRACETAICPHCGIDSVIGDASGLPVTKEFLDQMHERWFTRPGDEIPR